MNIQVTIEEKLEKGISFAILADGSKALKSRLLTNAEKQDLEKRRKASPGSNFFLVPRTGQLVAVAFTESPGDLGGALESCRRAGSKLSDLLQEHKVNKVYLTGNNIGFDEVVAFSEGLILASYRFLKYYSETNYSKKRHPLSDVMLVHNRADRKVVEEMEVVTRYTMMARDLVNEPAMAFSAVSMAEHIVSKASRTSIKSEILTRGRIEALKMGGILAVNRGSIDPPAFTIMEYSPANAVNSRPVVLVGKGLIFDTGGMNLKTGSYMDGMKSDMAGAAVIAATILSVATLGIPLHTIALLPSTDNRVNGNAMVPGDVITMHDGTTVEVNNTDAEGRLILADALSYAKKYKPMLAIDAATLTGAAARAIGPYGIVAMHQNASKQFEVLKTAGEETCERIAEFPMWKEYEELLKSDIADLSNIGGATAGAITAAKFLAHFTDYPFIHLDIAGTSFMDKRHHYIPKGGSGTGVRTLVKFLTYLAQRKNINE